MGVGEERLVLADRLALVVEHGPAAAHPARADLVRRHHRLAVRADDDLAVGVALRHRPRLGLNLLLNLPPETVGVGKTVLDFGLLAGLQVGGVSLARQGVDDGRLRVGLVLRAPVSKEVVHQPGSRLLQEGVRAG